MSRLVTNASIDITSGTIWLSIDVDPTSLTTRERVLVATLQQAFTSLPIERVETDVPGLPTEGEASEGPEADGISQPPHDSLEERRADSAEAAAAAEDAAGTGPEVTPARQPAPLQAAIGTARAENLGVRLLRALNELGGEIFDPSGRAATRLYEATGLDEGHRHYARSIMGVLVDAGHITRSVNGKRTSRICLTASGLAILDGDHDDEVETDEQTGYPCRVCDARLPTPGALGGHIAQHTRRGETGPGAPRAAAPSVPVERLEVVEDEQPAPPPPAGELFQACVHTCHLCGADFKSKPALGRHRATEHPISAAPHAVAI